jgi:hypothetical protein
MERKVDQKASRRKQLARLSLLLRSRRACERKATMSVDEE